MSKSKSSPGPPGCLTLSLDGPDMVPLFGKLFNILAMLAAMPADKNGYFSLRITDMMRHPLAKKLGISDLSQPSLSHYMMKLRVSGLIEVQRPGNGRPKAEGSKFRVNRDYVQWFAGMPTNEKGV